MQQIQPQDAPEAGKGNKKFLFIVIGIVALILIAAFAIVAAAVGIYFYTAKPKTPPFERPMPVSTPVAPTRSAKSDTTQNIIDVLKKWQTIGDFKLQNVTPTFSEATFDGSIGEAKGIFTLNGKTVIFIVAEYDSKTKAITKVTSIAAEQKKAGSKFDEGLKMTGSSITTQFTTAAMSAAVFCSWAEGKATLCHQISADDASTLRDFRKALRERRAVK